MALVGNPELIFLDEPTTGFDPSARREAWEVVRGLCAEGRTVVLTTHYMDEAQALADTVTVIAKGQVVAHRFTGHPGLVATTVRTKVRLWLSTVWRRRPALAEGTACTRQGEYIEAALGRPHRRAAPSHRMGHRAR